MSAVVPALLVVLAALVWPRRGTGGGRATLVLTTTEPSRFAFLGVDPVAAVRDVVRRRRGSDIDRELLPVVEALAGALRAGLPPGQALSLAATDVTGPFAEVLKGVERRARLGDGLAVGWGEAAERLDNEELRVLARAWSLSEETGTPLADAAQTTAAVLREEREQRARTKSAVAGARTTMTILSVLPLAGPVLAGFMGLDMRAVYAESPVVWAALGAGLVLVLVGRWWVGRLVTHTLAGPVLR